LRKLFENPRDITITGKKTSLKVYDGNKIQSIGNVSLNCARKGEQYNIDFVVIDKDVNTILGCESSQKCGFLKIMECDNQIGSCHK